MAGKTLIDTDLRDSIVTFLKEVADAENPVGLLTIRQRANELYWDTKPQRVRARKQVVVETAPEPVVEEPQAVENIPISQ